MLRVLESYAVNRCVGRGVAGYRDRGFPVGGPADGILATVARELAGVREDAAVWELAGPLEVVALGPVDLGVASRGEGFWVDEGLVKGCARVGLGAGGRLRIGAAERSARVYVSGDWRFRGIDRPVQRGEAVDVVPGSGPTGVLKLAEFPLMEGRLRWVRGQEFVERLDLGVVLGDGSRVGVRLRLGLPGMAGLGLSEPSVTGAMQVTPDGTLLIHGVEGPTIGGYPKIGGVISADWDRLGQLRAGLEVAFEEISLVEGRALARQRQEEVERWQGFVRGALLSHGVKASPFGR